MDGRGERVSKEADTANKIPTAAKIGIVGGKDSGSVQERSRSRRWKRMRGGTAMGAGGGSGPVGTREKSNPAKGVGN